MVTWRSKRLYTHSTNNKTFSAQLALARVIVNSHVVWNEVNVPNLSIAACLIVLLSDFFFLSFFLMNDIRWWMAYVKHIVLSWFSVHMDCYCHHHGWPYSRSVACAPIHSRITKTAHKSILINFNFTTQAKQAYTHWERNERKKNHKLWPLSKIQKEKKVEKKIQRKNHIRKCFQHVWMYKKKTEFNWLLRNVG